MSTAPVLPTLTSAERKALRQIIERPPRRVRNGWASGGQRISLKTASGLVGARLAYPSTHTGHLNLYSTVKGREILTRRSAP